ncbi:hypothetical protein KNT87_gp070 [Erwinia phage Cronus]|uniref:Uncharacterized protein n=1 Tax=Erwinia phage Cronus TaxID=2163633 RepID=A0A2S1GMA5_9CAUD|nr:hypothetical protein KNT87_gp070 [Erwinia phage Cronus]AWD90509.1 hypothetical protein [Erwinia phage Cronus]
MSIDLTLPAGDQVDLEIAVLNELRRRADTDSLTLHAWGEWRVLQGNILHGVQWSYIGEEVYDQDDNVIGIEFPDGVDAEIDCSWHEVENYEFNSK